MLIKSSLRTKLLIAVVIPLLALIYYLQQNVRAELQKKYSAEQVSQDVDLIAKYSRVIHEFQRERAYTLSFLNSKGVLEKESLSNQREVTDRAGSELLLLLKDQKRQVESLKILDSLSVIRLKVSSLAYEKELQIDEFYNTVKSGFIEEISEILRGSQSVTFKNLFEDHLLLLYTKEFLAQMRSLLGKAISKGNIDGLEFAEFAAIKGKYDINVFKFRNSASAELQEYFIQKFQGPFVQETFLIVDSVYRNGNSAKLPPLDRWLSNAGASVNALKEVVDHSSGLIADKAKAELAEANRKVFVNIVAAVIVIAIVLFILTFVVRGIVSSVGEIKSAADRLARGEADQLIEVRSKDELGALADAFNHMILVTKNFSSVADAIGSGDYTQTVQVRSDKDLLGLALDTMKLNLQKLSKENELRNWLLTGNNELNDRMRGEKSLKDLAQDIITHLTTYLKAQIGAIYLYENGQLLLTGSYAFDQRKDNANRFKLGQGFVGQAALEKKTILFHDIPNDYIRVNSGLGNTAPKAIIVYPFVYDNEVKGVVEIGSVHEFTEQDLEFMKMVGENIGIAFNTAQSRTQLKDLLEETQRQAEELEAQQEELRQSNEELQEKTELLEKSEAELKAQQEELQQSNEELEEKANLLEEQKEKLEIAKMEIENKARELEVTSKYKSEFLANMSHELRTPLNSNLILSQLLSENKNQSLGEKEVAFAKNIYNSGADLLNLINEILDLSKVEAGHMELDIAEVPLAELSEDLNSMFSEVAKNKAIDFTISISDEVAKKNFVTDKLRLEQILRNLLSNAFKFTGRGGKVSLTIGKPSKKPVLKNKKLNSVGEVIAFTVADSGIGIPEEKQGVIFEAFQQADGSTKRKYGGTGLGLSISRELSNALGGEIQLESEQGKGSSFTLFLPMKFDASLMTATERPVEVKETPRPAQVKIEKLPVAETNIKDDRENISENDKIILIMEDDEEFAQIILELVRERNYKGIVAVQGNTGLSFARHYKPDAIILDMKMPVMDGAEVLKHLKNDPDLRHIPVQIISGYDRRKEGLELGAFDFLRKPVDKNDLRNAFDKIEEFVSKKLKKLLVVEDDKMQNNAIRELIGNGDVMSYSAHSGSEALEMMKKEEYDCVIIDLGLPDMSGFELLETIKNNERLNKVPIVVYTGKDLSREENSRLMKFANTVVLKTADSHERLLDETMLFLHRVESRLSKEKQTIIRRLHKTDEVLKNRKVLVVDDDIRNIYSLTNVLEEEGIQCLTAENGKAAIKVLKEDPSIEMILMDVMMPEMDGYEATKEIRAIPKFSKLPIIALTAKAMKGDREKCLQAGMSDYIAKPVNIEQLLSLMRVWLYR